MSNKKFQPKRIIVFGFEGKNNKTENNYFSHFEPLNPNYILKRISCGVTDPKNMIDSIKKKRKDFDYDSKKDLTFVFVDLDCLEEKAKVVQELKSKCPRDIRIITSSPCFEIWFLNHFCYSTKEYKSNEDIIQDLTRFIPNYDKNKDYFEIMNSKTDDAIKNSYKQILCSSKSKTEVVEIVKKIIKKQS